MSHQIAPEGQSCVKLGGDGPSVYIYGDDGVKGLGVVYLLKYGQDDVRIERMDDSVVKSAISGLSYAAIQIGGGNVAIGLNDNKVDGVTCVYEGVGDMPCAQGLPTKDFNVGGIERASANNEYLRQNSSAPQQSLRQCAAVSVV